MNEFATFQINDVATTTNEETKTATLSGYAIVWGEVTSPNSALGGKQVIFNKGSIALDNNVLALWAHDWSKPLAATSNKTLRLSEDDHGLKVEMDLNQNTSIGKDVFEFVKSGLVKGMSFAAPVSSFQMSRSGKRGIWNVDKALLIETTVTPIPSVDATSIAVKQSKDFSEIKKELRIQKAKLDKYKLMTITGRVSGKA